MSDDPNSNDLLNKATEFLKRGDVPQAFAAMAFDLCLSLRQIAAILDEINLRGMRSGIITKNGNGH